MLLTQQKCFKMHQTWKRWRESCSPWYQSHKLRAHTSATCSTYWCKSYWVWFLLVEVKGLFFSASPAWKHNTFTLPFVSWSGFFPCYFNCPGHCSGKTWHHWEQSFNMAVITSIRDELQFCKAQQDGQQETIWTLTMVRKALSLRRWEKAFLIIWCVGYILLDMKVFFSF